MKNIKKFHCLLKNCSSSSIRGRRMIQMHRPPKRVHRPIKSQHNRKARRVLLSHRWRRRYYSRIFEKIVHQKSQLVQQTNDTIQNSITPAHNLNVCHWVFSLFNFLFELTIVFKYFFLKTAKCTEYIGKWCGIRWWLFAGTSDNKCIRMCTNRGHWNGRY